MISIGPLGREVLHFHLFCGLGGAARGMNRGEARVGRFVARPRCIGGVDVDPAAVHDFEALSGVRGTCLDLFDREQYRAFHGCEPPDGWREATPDDIRQAAGGERPHLLFTSPPCKGFSGLLSEARSAGPRYQALNRLTVRGLTLALQAWDDDPPEFVLLENVPRIATRGRALVDQIVSLLELWGYAVAETTHDCGELGGLAQSRKRFLLVARHRAKVPPFLYQPPRRRLRGVGEVLERLPLPGDPAAGPMHRMRSLQWRTWVRLAFVEAGSDWRSLDRLRVVDGQLADYGIAPSAAWYRGSYGVSRWGDPSCTVTGEAAPSCGRFAVADPRPEHFAEYGQLGVVPWDRPASTVTSQRSPGQGRFAVADPRYPAGCDRFEHQFRVKRWDAPAATVIGATRPGSGAGCVADPRLGCDADDRQSRRYNNVYRVVRWSDVGPAVTGGTGPSAGGVVVADPRPAWSRTHGEAFRTAGHYGVVPWAAPCGAVRGSGSADNGTFCVADPRGDNGDHIVDVNDMVLPAPDDRLVAVIRALDGTWHRPFTTLELAALQGLVDPDEHLELAGTSDTAWRERIGNAVPSPAAAAIASVMCHALLLAWAGETWELSALPVWVRPVATALSVEGVS